jgi:1,4-dihydroxy-2-naphthoyl-CoA synthase
MTDFQNLHFETKNHIAIITIDRPKVLNALSMAVMDKLRQAKQTVSYQGTASAVPICRTKRNGLYRLWFSFVSGHGFSRAVSGTNRTGL